MQVENHHKLGVMTALTLLTLLLTSVWVSAYGQVTEHLEVEITSHKSGQNVNAGELTIYGTSSDDGVSDCEVYADWNDLKPYQDVVATGPEGNEDYSTWEFTYTQEYHLIEVGPNNELTAKFYCHEDPENAVWDTIDLVGVNEDNFFDHDKNGDKKRNGNHDIVYLDLPRDSKVELHNEQIKLKHLIKAYLDDLLKNQYKEISKYHSEHHDDDEWDD